MRKNLSYFYLILILALVVCLVLSRRSHKKIGASVAVLVGALIGPVTGNLIIIMSGNRQVSTAGCYIYFIGMDLVMVALLRFTFDYCDLTWPGEKIWYLVHSVLVIDVVQFLFNPFFGHAFDIEPIEVEGFDYYRLVPHYGQSFHRLVDYGIFLAVLVIFFIKVFHSSRYNSERYTVILITMVCTGLLQTYYIFSRTPVDRSMTGYGIFGILVFYFSLYYRPLRLLDRMLVNITSQMPEALFFYDAEGQCIWANTSGIRLADLKEDDFEKSTDQLCQKFGQLDMGEGDWSCQRVSGAGDNARSYVLENHIMKDSHQRVAGSFLIIRDNTDEHKNLQRETWNANHDRLTGLYNRAAYEIIQESLELNKVYMFMIDIDHFKDVNDTYGHEIGDRILIKAAGIIKKNFRSDDFVCRLGGDEFLVFMVNAGEEQKLLAGAKIDRINAALSASADGLPPVSVSVGIAFGKDAADFRDLFEKADKALYGTKHRGRVGYTLDWNL